MSTYLCRWEGGGLRTWENTGSSRNCQCVFWEAPCANATVRLLPDHHSLSFPRDLRHVTFLYEMYFAHRKGLMGFAKDFRLSPVMQWFHIESTLKSLGGLVKTLIAELYPHNFWFSRCAVDPWICVSNKCQDIFINYGCITAAAKSLQSCLTLCNPIDGSPPGSPIPGIL